MNSRWRENLYVHCVFARTTEGEIKCSDPCALGLQVILKCHGLRNCVTAQCPL